jgi:PST family polysaccharide transporter
MFRQDAAFFIAYFGIVVGNILFPMWYFQGMEKMKYITLFNIVAKTVSCLPFFVFVRKPADYALVPYFYSLGFILAGTISIYIIYGKEKRKWMMPTVREIKFALKDSFTYFLSRISVSMYTYVNTFVIGLAGGNVAIGYYSAAEKLYQAYNNLIIPLSGVLFPHIAKTRNVKFFRKLLKIIVPSNVIFIALAMAASWYIVYFMYGTTDYETLTVFRILLVACLATIPSMLMGYPFLAAMGHAKYTNLTLIGASILHIAGLAGLYFMGMLNIYTVAGMVVVTEMTVCALRIRGIVKYKLLAGKVLMKN